MPLTAATNHCHGPEIIACAFEPGHPPDHPEQKMERAPAEPPASEISPPPSALPPGRQMFDLPPRRDDDIAVRATMMMNRRSFIAPFVRGNDYVPPARPNYLLGR